MGDEHDVTVRFTPKEGKSKMKVVNDITGKIDRDREHSLDQAGWALHDLIHEAVETGRPPNLDRCRDVVRAIAKVGA